MGKSDIFQKKMESTGIITVFSMKCYVWNEAPENIEIILFETKELGLLSLNVDIDTDELFWEQGLPSVSGWDEYKEIKSPFSLDRYIVFLYWKMMNNFNCYDGIQFCVRLESKKYTDYSYYQFMGEASQITCNEFGKFRSTNE